MKYLLAIGALLLALNGLGQTVLLEENVNEDTIPATSGPNLKNYVHTYFAYGLILGETETDFIGVETGSSGEYIFGVRYKRKINSWESIGLDLSYSYSNYVLEEGSAGKTFPDTNIWDREALQYHNLVLAAYNRINFGQRGNKLGKYLDLGAWGEFALGNRHVIKNELNGPNPVNSDRLKLVYSDLRYTHAGNYGVLARVGFNWFAIYGKYRLSDLFKSEFGYPEMPRWRAGIEWNLSF